MRTGDPPTQPRPRIEVTSWLGDEQLGDVLPVGQGSWTVTDQAEVQVPGSVAFDVPNVPQWRPVANYRHPLAAFGQQLRVRVGFGSELHPWGTFRLTRAESAGAVIQVQGVGLLRNVERARFTKPFGVGGWTRRQTLIRALQGILPVWIDPVLGSPVLPSSLWERERIDAVWDIVTSWPARMFVDETGTLIVTTPWDDANPGPAVWELVDGVGGNLVSLDPAIVGDGDGDFPNAWVVSTTPSGSDTKITEVWTQPYGPMQWDTTGSGYGQNPNFYESPLLPADRGVLQRVAADRGRRAQRLQTKCSFTAAPDSRPQVGDIAHVRSKLHSIDGVGRIMSLALTRTALTGEVSML